MEILNALVFDRGKQDWAMSVSGFFDESGKFNDHAVVAFGGVAARTELFQNSFVADWRFLLHDCGLICLSVKDAFNYRRPLSAKVEALGLNERIKVILPFIACIRLHLQLIVGCAIDVEAFKRLPSHYYQVLGDNPIFTAFLSMVMEVLKDIPTDDQLSFICDDEEETALPMYKFYRRVKLVMPEVRDQMAAISFADDRYLFGLQAADIISSLIRQEAGREFFGQDYEYRPLFEVLKEFPKNGESVRRFGVAFCDKKKLTGLADNLLKDKRSSGSV